jgi:hypothetical protein
MKTAIEVNLRLTTTLIALAIPALVTQAQTPVRVKEAGCAFGGINRNEEIVTFDPDESVERMTQKLLKYVGLPRGKIVLYAATVANAQADIDENNRRVVFYSQRFIHQQLSS